MDLPINRIARGTTGLLLAYLVYQASVWAAPVLPDGSVLVEAEARPEGPVVADPTASGGRFVVNDRAWQPMIMAPLPIRGDRFVIWVRYRGTGLQLKGTAADGTQRPLNWLYEKPAAFRWASFGVHTRAELGDRFLIIRGGSSEGVAAVDAVVIASDQRFNPATAFAPLPDARPAEMGPTDPPARPISAQIRVDWRRVLSRSTRQVFGTNDFQILYDRDPVHRLYYRRLAEIGPGVLRLHNAGLSDAWSDPQKRAWKPEAIASAYDALLSEQPDPVTIVQNIPGWPHWMKQDRGQLDASEYDNYARFAAGLVRIVNGDQKRGVRFWEPLNEQDNAYKRAGRLDELWKIYNLTARAMKAVDPTIRVGGPAATYDDRPTLESFLKASAPNVDFLSWHRYGSGNRNDSTDALMAYTPRYGDQVATFRALAKRYIPDRPVPLLLGEYNINYSYRSGETRQHSQAGAAWFASVLKHLAESGIDMATSWNARDTFYGLLDNSKGVALRPAAVVFGWANRYLVGDVVRTESDEEAVEALCVCHADGSRGALLINKSAGPATVRLDLGEAGKATARRLESPFNPEASFVPQGPIALGPYGVVLLQLPRIAEGCR